MTQVADVKDFKGRKVLKELFRIDGPLDAGQMRHIRVAWNVFHVLIDDVPGQQLGDVAERAM